MKYIQKIIVSGYFLIVLLIGGIAYIWHDEWQAVETLEIGNQQIDEFRKSVNHIHIRLIEFSLLGETILEWDDKDLEHYHIQRMTMDSMLCRFKNTYPSERIDSVRYLLEDKERQMSQIIRLLDEQQSINQKIASRVPIIAQKSVQEQSKKPKRKGFLGIFGKKGEVKPTATTSMLHSLDKNVISEQKAQNIRLLEYADSLAMRNIALNKQLQGLILQIEDKVQANLQNRESEIAAMRKRSFMQIGGLMGFVLLLLAISYIVIHCNAKSIKRYKHKTADLIGQLERSVQQNEALIASRKKAVHTITHELRTPLAAISGYTELLQKECSKGNNTHFIQSIQESSDRMRKMLNTLLDFFRLDNGKEQPRLSPCRISTIAHTLETEFMPTAMNKGLSLTVRNESDAVVLTDRERIIQIGNNLLSNAFKFTEKGGVSLVTDYTEGILKLVVEDTGTGMTKEEQQQVFDAFERLSNAAAKDGFGLGLTIVKNIVTMLSGKIRLESEKGKGSRFTVEIPMQKAEEIPEKEIQTYIHREERNLNVVA
ncbi:sensor histidine kinase, partial [Bacteroides sp.]|uniref:sensor histidine kinase n=1 Tax=Bacteroides sp. TaxID=29523 RepID=UPI003AB2FBAD